MEQRIRGILKESAVTEFKWQKLNNAKYRLCASKLLDFTLQHLWQHRLRVDVLIWDTQDSRHGVRGRDDEANYERMFFHLLQSVLKRREKNAEWHLFPDERLGIDWETVANCLACVGRRKEVVAYPLLGEFFSDPYCRIQSFRQVCSHETPCCQLADLFAGISVFSKAKFETYTAWKDQASGSLNLFAAEQLTFSNRDKERFRLIEYLDRGCKRQNLGVSLQKRRGFWSPNPRNPLNFWHYTPQHEMDKAPKKSRAR